MADLFSVIQTNDNAVPQVRNSAGVQDGRRRTTIAQFEADGTQSNTDTLRMLRLNSNAVVHNLFLSCDAISGLTSVDVGLYIAGPGGAVVDDDVFDSVQTLAVALVRQEKRVGADSALGVETLGQPLWQLAGLTEDPNVAYDVVILINTAGSASGTIVLEAEFTGAN